ncbi:Heme oxygenase 1 [Pseudozyma hubeiensis]|nr:Heme oxygenase 1 [Pseudozyma hubeiensis]
MTCPFAKFASILPIAPSSSSTSSYHSTHHHHPHHASASTHPTSLSEALRLGTAASHRAVEKSRGVSLLLQSVSSPSSEAQLKFDRLDYVKFLIQLACIYSVLEACLEESRGDNLVGALFEGGLMKELKRAGALWRDVEDHLEVVELHTGAGLADLADQMREERSFASSNVAAVGVDVEDPLKRETLFRLVSASSPDTTLTRDHIDLLSPAQTSSTLKYITSLLDLSNTTNAGLLLSHAYTRYLGDLSGGQHILKKVSKRFPILASTDKPHVGFEFYHFSSGQDLKTRFRSAMESNFTSLPTAQIAALVTEANIAFDLNTEIFESLLPPDLRLSPNDKVPSPHKILLEPSAPVKPWARAEIAAVGGIFVAATAALVVASVLGTSSAEVAVHA